MRVFVSASFRIVLERLVLSIRFGKVVNEPPPHFSLPPPPTLGGSKIFARACGARALKRVLAVYVLELRF